MQPPVKGCAGKSAGGTKHLPLCPLFCLSMNTRSPAISRVKPPYTHISTFPTRQHPQTASLSLQPSQCQTPLEHISAISPYSQDEMQVPTRRNQANQPEPINTAAFLLPSFHRPSRHRQQRTYPPIQVRQMLIHRSTFFRFDIPHRPLAFSIWRSLWREISDDIGCGEQRRNAEDAE